MVNETLTPGYLVFSDLDDNSLWDLCKRFGLDFVNREIDMSTFKKALTEFLGHEPDYSGLQCGLLKNSFVPTMFDVGWTQREISLCNLVSKWPLIFNIGSGETVGDTYQNLPLDLEEEGSPSKLLLVVPPKECENLPSLAEKLSSKFGVNIPKYARIEVSDTNYSQKV